MAAVVLASRSSWFKPTVVRRSSCTKIAKQTPHPLNIIHVRRLYDDRAILVRTQESRTFAGALARAAVPRAMP